MGAKSLGIGEENMALSDNSASTHASKDVYLPPVVHQSGKVSFAEPQKSTLQLTGKRPWNPKYWFISLSFFFGFGAAGILAGINWHRLGKTKWIWPTIVLSILGELGLAALFSSFLYSCLIYIFFAINLGIGFLFSYLQYPAYKNWLATYDVSGTKSPSWAIPIGIGIGHLAIFLAVALL